MAQLSHSWDATWPSRPHNSQDPIGSFNIIYVKHPWWAPLQQCQTSSGYPWQCLAMANHDYDCMPGSTSHDGPVQAERLWIRHSSRARSQEPMKLCKGSLGVLTMVTNQDRRLVSRSWWWCWLFDFGGDTGYEPWVVMVNQWWLATLNDDW